MKNLNKNNILSNDENKISVIIKSIFEINEENKFLVEKDFIEKIESHEIFKKINLENINRDDFYLFLYVVALDSEDTILLDYLFNNHVKKNTRDFDILYDICMKEWLNSERLKFLFEKKNSVLNVSSNLIRHLLNNRYKKELLNIIFKNSRFYDNDAILEFCHCFKHKKPMSDFELKNIINNENYIISLDYELGYGQYLNQAAEKNQEYIVKYLVEHGAIINMTDDDEYTPLLYACENDNENIIKYLIEHGAYIEQENCHCDTPLILACTNGNEKLVKYLIENGANADRTNYIKSNPLIYACRYDRETIAKYLVENGANVNQINEYDYFPLRYACKNGNESLVKYLVENGACVDIEGGGDDDDDDSFNNNNNNNNNNNKMYTALMAACESRNETLIKYLIECGANLEADGSDCLIIACKNENENIVKYLIDQGVDPNIPEKEDKPSYRPRQLRIRYIDKEKEDSTIPLIIACEKKNEIMVKYLVEGGADVNQKDSKNRNDSPLIISCWNENKEIVKYLIEHGADVNQKNEAYPPCNTPLGIALYIKNEFLAKY